MSRVDVVIPCYKYAHFLKECVRSVLSQQGVDVRVLVIDDCSPDNTPEVGAALVAEDSRVEFRRHAENCRHIATYNEGLLEWAGGDYVLLLSADDMLTPGALARATSLMDQHPEVVFTYGNSIATNKPDYDAFVPPATYQTRVVSGPEFWELSCLDAVNLVATPTLVIRTKVQQAVGGYRPELPHTGDLEMVMRLAAHGSVGVVNCDQAFYRVHGQNMHKATFQAAMTVIEQHRLAFRMLFENHHQQVPNCDRLKEVAMRRMAVNTLRRGMRLFEQGDAEGCDKMAEVAAEIDEKVKDHPEWRKFRIKRMMGPQLCATVGKLARRLRRPRRVNTSPFGDNGLFQEQ